MARRDDGVATRRHGMARGAFVMARVEEHMATVEVVPTPRVFLNRRFRIHILFWGQLLQTWKRAPFSAA